MRMRDVVDVVTSDEPPLRHSVDDIVGAGRRVQRRRRLGWSAAAVATAVAMTAAIVVPAQLGRPAPPVGAPTTSAPAGPFSFTFAAYEVGRLRVDRPLVVSTAYEIAPVRSVGKLHAYLVLYRPGAFQPTGQPNVTIAGRPGIERSPKDTGNMSHRTLAWQYADNAWATIDSFASDEANPSAQELRDLAAGLRPAPAVEAKIPFRMSYVPAGFRPVVFGSHVMAGLDGIAGVDQGDFGGAIFAKPAPPATGLTKPWNESGGDGIPGSFEIFIVPNANSNQALQPGEAPPGKPKCIKSLCNAWSADGRVNIQIAVEGNALSEAEMTRVLEGITLATVTDDSTWPTVSTAVPM